MSVCYKIVFSRQKFSLQISKDCPYSPSIESSVSNNFNVIVNALINGNQYAMNVPKILKLQG